MVIKFVDQIHCRYSVALEKSIHRIRTLFVVDVMSCKFDMDAIWGWNAHRTQFLFTFVITLVSNMISIWFIHETIPMYDRVFNSLYGMKCLLCNWLMFMHIWYGCFRNFGFIYVNKDSILDQMDSHNAYSVYLFMMMYF